MMKGRRITQTYIVKEAGISSSDRPYRNLSKAQLGAVVFCCQNNTVIECLSKQLFGLPAQHFVYVKNISVGLPLFLFNNSDRKLYGIFEAASHGRLNIDPYAWTSDGSQRTQYPAQVQIRVRMQCCPIMEDQLRKIIGDNYYAPTRFWLELDHSQTSCLLAKLSAISLPPLNNESQRMFSNLVPPRSVEKKLSASSRQSSSGSGTTHLSQTSRDPVIHSPRSYKRSGDVDAVLKKLKELCVVGERPVDDVKLDDCSRNNPGPFFDVHSVIKQLMQEVEDLKSFKTEHLGKTVDLEGRLNEAEAEIMQLREQCISSEHMSNTTSVPGESDTDVSSVEPSMDDDAIIVVGGYDGTSWLSTLGILSPSKDTLKSLGPMSCVRSYAAATILEDKLFVLGGGDGNTWYNSVESYDRGKDRWIPCPALGARKGSLGGVTVNGKIFAVGGGDGVESFSDVEMFDPNVGRWIKTQSMLKKRFALSAVELNGAIYAVGGYDGKEYLKSVERFDPRAHPWRKIENLNRCRGCHSVSILNEKLYVIGGYDGSTMVRSVEVFDPRQGSWGSTEPMNRARGYSSAISLNDSIYVLGGIQDEDVIDTVEVYNEVFGIWRATENKALGKRCFFSALAAKGWGSVTDF